MIISHSKYHVTTLISGLNQLKKWPSECFRNTASRRSLVTASYHPYAYKHLSSLPPHPTFTVIAAGVRIRIQDVYMCNKVSLSRSESDTANVTSLYYTHPKDMFVDCIAVFCEDNAWSPDLFSLVFSCTLKNMGRPGNEANIEDEV